MLITKIIQMQSVKTDKTFKQNFETGKIQEININRK